MCTFTNTTIYLYRFTKCHKIPTCVQRKQKQTDKKNPIHLLLHRQMVISVFIYLGWLQKKLVEVYQVWLDGQQNAAVNSVTPLKSLSVHYTIHPVVKPDQTHMIK